jgi:regulatory protein YycI of two-component signal transduction system YycFG
MSRKILRKDKIVLYNVNNEKDTITFIINIESNHVNNQLDQILSAMSSMTNDIVNYKQKVKDEKPIKSKKNKGFGNSGEYV